MGSWSGRNASARSRTLVFIALGTFLLGTYLLLHPRMLRSGARLGQKPSKGTPAESAQNITADKHADKLPPMYPNLKIAELALPQHDEDLPFPEGKNARFVRFGNQMWGVGLNNQLFEM